MANSLVHPDLTTTTHDDLSDHVSAPHVMHAEVDTDGTVLRATVTSPGRARIGDLVRTADGYSITGVRGGGPVPPRELPGADAAEARRELARRYFVRRLITDHLAMVNVVVAHDPAAVQALADAVALVCDLAVPADPDDVLRDLARPLVAVHDAVAGNEDAEMALAHVTMFVTSSIAPGAPVCVTDGVGDAFALARRGNCGPNYRPAFYR